MKLIVYPDARAARGEVNDRLQSDRLRLKEILNDLEKPIQRIDERTSRIDDHLTGNF
jgi:hypothetical protein